MRLTVGSQAAHGVICLQYDDVAHTQDLFSVGSVSDPPKYKYFVQIYPFVRTYCSCYTITGFTKRPIDRTVAEGVEVVFTCQHPTAHIIGWKLNGRPLLDASFENVSATTTSVAGDILNELTIAALHQYNLTQIECVASFFDDSEMMESGPVTMKIQGRCNNN